jgi:c(7)-type cytochrome triheme protein
MGLVSLSCSAVTRARVLGTVLDGVPDPSAPVAAAPQRSPNLVDPVDAQALAPGAELAPVALVIPPAPFEELQTWNDVLKALPTDAGGGVDWVEAFERGLVTPKLLHSSSSPIERPLTLDTLMDLVVDDPRLPALDLDVTLTPSANSSFDGGPLYDVTFPHTSHTSWLGCTSCHPGVLATKTDMRGILEGEYCGRCHGRVSFDPEVSCSRCHSNLVAPSVDVLGEEIAAATREPVARSPEVVARGREIYQAKCAICHGETGDGAGPLSPPLDTKPRDFTAGKYKFRSTLPSSIPTALDIFTVISRGVPGTSMPAFTALSREDRWALTHYVKTFSDAFEKSEPQPIPMAPAPDVTPELLAMGLDLYQQAGCNTCHGDTGRGDGPSAPTLKDEWDNPAPPYNFASGRPLKSGTGPEAVYRSVMTGLQGTPMPGFGDALEAEQGWALALYVLTLFDQDKQPFAVKGDVEFVGTEAVQNTADAQAYPAVVFPHWFHRIRVKCASCHPSVFEMRAGANAVTMDALRSGEFCATCHNGREAWEIGFSTCIKCHVTPDAEGGAGKPVAPTVLPQLRRTGGGP